ncbi:MAG: class B sortase [Lachnospiraceae bacterium]|nr:class B sortase [Lachnospiraceae bacterium]
MKEKQEKQEKKEKKWALNILTIVFILVFLASGLYLLRYYMTAKNAEGALNELVELRAESEAEDDGIEVKTPEGKTILKKYKKLYKRNSDLIGWITIKNSQIDYPVMQTPNDPEYYLHKNYDKKDDVNGLLFLDAQCDVEDAYNNLMLYGHHMKSGMMFGHLVDYDSKDYYEKHKIIQFDTLYEEREYEVAAAFYSQVYKQDDDVFKYYNWPGHLSEKQFDNYIKNVKKLSQYDTGITPEYGEQLLTLVTCAYHTENGRFVVVARRKK